MNLILNNPTGIGEQLGESVIRIWHYDYKFPPDPDPNLPPWYGRMEPGDEISSYIILEGEGDTPPDAYVNIYCSVVNEELDDDEDIENIRQDLLTREDIPHDKGWGIYDKSSVMIITYMRYHMTEIISNETTYIHFTDTTGDGLISLDEFCEQPLEGLTPAPNSMIMFDMTVKFADGTAENGFWNEYQGDRTNMTLMFSLVQGTP